MLTSNPLTPSCLSDDRPLSGELEDALDRPLLAGQRSPWRSASV